MIHPYPGRPPHIELAAHQEGLAAHSRGELVYCTRIYPPCTFPHCKLDACVPALWLQFFSTPFRVQSQFRAHKRTMLWLFLLEAIEEAIEEVIEETIVESNATHA